MIDVSDAISSLVPRPTDPSLKQWQAADEAAAQALHGLGYFFCPPYPKTYGNERWHLLARHPITKEQRKFSGHDPDILIAECRKWIGLS